MPRTAIQPDANPALNGTIVRRFVLPLPPVREQDEIVRRVVAQISESVVREIAWEVVPDCVERVIKEMTAQEVSKH